MQKPKIGKIPFSGVVYQWLVALASAFFPVVGFFSSKIKLFLVGRIGWKDRLRRSMESIKSQNQLDRPVIIFHCASVGEFEQARPVMEQLHRNLPGHRILLTFFSPSGFELRKNYSGADLVFYLPIDSKSNVKDFLDIVRPSLILIVKYEFWPNLLLECHQQSIPVVSISAIFRTDHFYFKPYASYFLLALKTIQHYFVQDQSSKEILARAEINQVSVVGDTRFDRVLTVKAQAAPIPVVEQFVASSPTLVIGSAWPEDMKILGSIITQLLGKIKVIVIPHEVDPASIQMITKYLPDYQLYSSWNAPSSSSVLVVDQMGLLSRIYAYGTFAWIGGAYGKGLHNILEAAVYGLPVFFGNRNYKKFREAQELIQIGCAFPIGSSSEFEIQINKILSDKNVAEEISSNALKYIHQHAGATDSILKYLTSILDQEK